MRYTQHKSLKINILNLQVKMASLERFETRNFFFNFQQDWASVLLTEKSNLRINFQVYVWEKSSTQMILILGDLNELNLV